MHNDSFHARMKKVFAFTFFIYIIALTLTPCPDYGNHAENAMHDLAGTEQAGDSGHHEDCCSPFCTCSCCGVLFEAEKISLLTRDSSPPKTLIFFFDPQFESNYLFTIWDPPKA